MTNFYKGRKVFIAGGAGLIGQALVRKLVPLGADVTATEWKARKIGPEFRGEIGTILGGIDLRAAAYSDLIKLYEGQEIVFWAAAKVGGARAIREKPSDLIHYNLEMAARNIKAAVDAGVKRFAFVSSSYCYPDLDRPAREEDIWAGDVPLIHYGLGWVKRYLETLCRHHHMTSNTRFAIARPVALYGPYDDFDLETCHVVPALIRKFADGPYPVEIWGDGSEVRQFTYSEDFVEGLLRIVEDYCVADPVNIAANEQTSVRELAELIASRTNWPDINFSGSGARAIGKRVSDVSKAKRRLGFECKMDLAAGLKLTLDWYRKNHVETAG